MRGVVLQAEVDHVVIQIDEDNATGAVLGECVVEVARMETDQKGNGSVENVRHHRGHDWNVRSLPNEGEEKLEESFACWSQQAVVLRAKRNPRLDQQVAHHRDDVVHAQRSEERTVAEVAER